MLTELETAQIFATSSYLKALIFFRLLTSGIAVIFMAVLELNRKKLVAHSTLKMLINLHGFWTFVLSFSTFIESVMQAHAHFTLKYAIGARIRVAVSSIHTLSHRDSTDLLLTPNQCLLRMTPQFFGICGSVTSLLVMSFERFEASRNLSTYESSTRFDGMKYVLLHISLTLCGVFTDVVKYDFPTRVAHCSVASVVGKDIQTALVAALSVCELMTIYFYTKTLKKNESLQTSGAALLMPLTERYQLSENIRVLRLLLPIVISHTSITLAAALPYFVFELSAVHKELYPMLEGTINMVYLQGIAMPLIFIIRYRSKLSKENRLFAANRSTGVQLISTHDRVIQRGW